MSADTVGGIDGMSPEVIEDVYAVRHNAGAWQRADHTFVRIIGADAASWLHSQTTNDVEGLESGQGRANAILDRQGRLQGHFTLHRWEDEYWMLVERAQWPRIHEHLDAHLFIENVQMEEAGEELEQVVIQGPRTLRYLAALLDKEGVEASHLLPSAPWGCHPLELLGFEVLAFRVSLTGEDGYVFVVERGQGGALLDALVAGGGNAPLPRIRDEAIEILRIEAGIPKFGVDMDATNPVPETTLERTAVSYEKGCYIGQEVVARLRTYGSVKQALVGLVFEDERGIGFQPMHSEPESLDIAQELRLTAKSTDRVPLGLDARSRLEAHATEPRSISVRNEDPLGPIVVRQGANLPHWTREGATYFVTFRLFGTIPRSVMEQWRLEKRAMEAERRASGQDAGPAETHDYLELVDRLDKASLGSGRDWLANADVAKVVQDALLFFQGKRYFLYAWSIMPTHVHAVVRPFAGIELSRVLHSWKSFTANAANRLLGRSGSFWQDEPYDHLVRDADDFLRCANYTWMNPENAGYRDWPWRGFAELEDALGGSSGSEGSAHREPLGLDIKSHGLEAHATESAPEDQDLTRDPQLSAEGAYREPSGPDARSHGLEAHATVLYANTKRVGRITSRTHSPTLDAEIALAYMDREHRASGEVYELRVEGWDVPIRARVRALPFYEAPDRAERAQALYEEALGLFEMDLEDEDVSAIPLLKEAVLLDAEFEDAYEALGVILNRHQRVDEAIHYMLRLAALNPNCLMAHTNLSVFYVAKGMIAEAEEEKANAAVLGIQRAADERRAKEMAEAERTRLELEARQRIEMFAEVLEIDPDDPVATFGTGKAHVQLNQYAEAVPFFERAAEAQNDYSAAWLSLGKCHEFLGASEAATQAYRRGIDAASRKGDLMPLREMERRLNALGSAAGVHAAAE